MEASSLKLGEGGGAKFAAKTWIFKSQECSAFSHVLIHTFVLQPCQDLATSLAVPGQGLATSLAVPVSQPCRAGSRPNTSLTCVCARHGAVLGLGCVCARHGAVLGLGCVCEKRSVDARVAVVRFFCVVVVFD